MTLRLSLDRAAAAAAIVLAAAAPAAALVITPTYDTTVTSSPDKVEIESAFSAVIAQDEALYTNPITVTVTLELSPDVGLGENETYVTNLTGGGSVSYSQFRSALLTAGSNGDAIAATEAATLPNTTNAPIDSTSEIELSLPNARALGFTGSSFNPPSGSTNSTLYVTSNPSTVVQFARVDGQIGVDNYDFTSVVEHELDEILGLGSALNDASGDTLPGFIRPEDLLRFDQDSTTRSFTLSSSAMAFVSINGGASDLVQLSQDPNGDYGDFYSPGYTSQDEDAPCLDSVQVAFTCPGHAQSVSGTSVEVQMLAAMGYDPRFPTATTNTTWAVDCAAGTVAGSGVQTVSLSGYPEPGSSGTPDALGALLGTPTQGPTISPAPAPGDVIAITGICRQDVTVKTSKLVISNREGLDGMSDDEAVEDADGVEGQLEIAGAQNVVVTGLSLGDYSTTFSFAAAGDVAALSIHDGATVAVLHSAVSNSPAIGALVQRQSQVTFLDDSFYFNGFYSGAAGIAVADNSRVMLGADDGSLAVSVEGSGGDGVNASDGSTLIVNAAQLTLNGDRQLALLTASSARLSGSGILVELYDASLDEGESSCQSAHGAACGAAIEAAGASALRLENGASVSSIDRGGGGGSADAIELVGSSALLAEGANIEAPSGAGATIDAGENSIIALAGGNTICSGVCTSATTGVAISIDHVATFIQAVPASFGFAAAADTIYGGGKVQLQSTVDVGQGTIGEPGPASLAWNTGSSAIAVAQNSSFRLEGGTAITGALKLSQGSNGFFNTNNGGSNSVSGGVTCPFTSIPASHVAGPTAVTPNVALASSFLAAPAGTCLPF